MWRVLVEKLSVRSKSCLPSNQRNDRTTYLPPRSHIYMRDISFHSHFSSFFIGDFINAFESSSFLLLLDFVNATMEIVAQSKIEKSNGRKNETNAWDE